MTIRPTRDVLANCRTEHDQPTQDWEGYCLMFTRTMFAADALYRSAADAWIHADHQHPVRTGALVPRGVPVWWLGGSEGFGHVAVSAGSGMCWSTDWGGAGQVNLARIDDITTRWNLDLAGWSEDLNEQRVWQPRTAVRTPRLDLIVETARDARRATGNTAKDADLTEIIRLARRWSVTY